MAWGLAHISSRELSEWQAFDAISPIGETRADFRAGLLASMIANAWYKRDKPFTINEFMYFEESTEAVPSPGSKMVEVDDLPVETQRAWLEMLNSVYGGQDLRNK